MDIGRPQTWFGGVFLPQAGDGTMQGIRGAGRLRLARAGR